ncbi:MAG TPA: hypothetical protein P5526_23820 [Anaerolineae bacterium]|nr:hypothetical protein [Anaerolineae bacterium]
MKTLRKIYGVCVRHLLENRAGGGMAAAVTPAAPQPLILARTVA